MCAFLCIFLFGLCLFAFPVFFLWINSALHVFLMIFFPLCRYSFPAVSHNSSGMGVTFEAGCNWIPCPLSPAPQNPRTAPKLASFSRIGAAPVGLACRLQIPDTNAAFTERDSLLFFSCLSCAVATQGTVIRFMNTKVCSPCMDRVPSVWGWKFCTAFLTLQRWKVPKHMMHK